jgi:pre-rRNA-processing protein TSR1
MHVLNARRLGREHGSRIVAFFPLSSVADAHNVRTDVERLLGAEAPSERGGPPRRLTKDGLTVTLLTPSELDLLEMVDAAMVADVAMFVVRVGEGGPNPEAEPDLPLDEGMTTSTWYSDIGLGLDDAGRRFVSCVNSQGVPAIVVVLQGLRAIPSAKRRNHLIKIHLRYFRSMMPPSQVVLHTTDTEEDTRKLWRSLKEGSIFTIHWREARPYLLAEDLDYRDGVLRVSGSVRGKPLSADQLVHITNFGTYQIDSIEAGEGLTIDRPTSAQESTEYSLPLDPMAGEQTWPTAEDFKTHSRTMKVPEGFSEYQAAWVDFEGNEIPFDEPVAPDVDDLPEDGNDDDDEGDDGSEINEDDVDEGGEKKVIDDDPDVVELERGTTARERLAKYRGFTSFRANWDPKENLPPSYSRIFTLPNFKRIVKEGVKCSDGVPSTPGVFITVAIRGVPQQVYDVMRSRPSMPIILSGLLPHEQQWSVLHMSVMRDPEYEEPIKSKQRALYQIGFRRVLVCPLYSDLGRGDRTKYVRYFMDGESVRCATMFGPITHSPAPVMVYLRGGGQWNFVMHGNILPPNPNLLVLKRAMLTGHPAKVHKRQAIIKFMFFNSEDIDWFKPVELRTRYGHRGKIQKAIGTHGSFKAAFKNVVQQHDTVYLELWKRVFPKWTTRMYDLSVVKFQQAPSGGTDEGFD